MSYYRILNIASKVKDAGFITGKYKDGLAYFCPNCSYINKVEYGTSIDNLKMCSCTVNERKALDLHSDEERELKLLRAIEKAICDDVKIIELSMVSSGYRCIKLVYVCNICQSVNTAIQSDVIDLIANNYIYQYNICCHEQKIKSNNFIQDQKVFKKIVKQKYENVYLTGKDGRRYKRTSVYSFMCDKKHDFRTVDTALKTIETCPVCKAIENVEFFKVLNELGVLYKIKEDFDRGGVKCKLKYKLISRCNILTYNEAGHLTGKITFNDAVGDKNAQARKNHLVFRWIQGIEKLDDREWCLNFLDDYFKEVISKNNLLKEEL